MFQSIFCSYVYVVIIRFTLRPKENRKNIREQDRDSQNTVGPKINFKAATAHLLKEQLQGYQFRFSFFEHVFRFHCSIVNFEIIDNFT